VRAETSHPRPVPAAKTALQDPKIEREMKPYCGKMLFSHGKSNSLDYHTLRAQKWEGCHGR